MVRNAVLLLSPFLGVTSACMVRHQPADGTSLKHDLGIYAASGAEAFRWRAVTDAEYETYILDQFNRMMRDANGDPSFSSAPLPNDDPRVEKVRNIAAGIDKTIRAANPERLKSVPAPKVEVLDTLIPNGMVGTAYVCYDAVIQFEAAISTNPSQLEDVGFGCASLTQTGGIFVPETKGGGACRCIEQAATHSELVRIVEWMNANVFDRRETTCMLAVQKQTDNTTPRILATGCDDDARKTKVGNLNHLRKLVFSATADRVSISLGAMKAAKNEDQLVATLAHELAHYYRSHANAPFSDYGFFYSLAEVPDSGRPVRKPELERTGELMKRVVFPYAFERPPGLRFDPRLVSSFGAIVRSLPAEGVPTPNPSCHDVGLQWNSKAAQYARGLSDVPTDSTALHAFEDAVLNCLESIRIETDVPGRGKLRSTLSNYFSRDISGLELPYIFECGKPITATGTLREVMESLEAALAGVACDKERVLREVVEKRIGWYTIEQEADEFSLEYLCMSGRPPKSALVGALNLLDATGNFQHAPFTGSLDCRALYEGGWKKEGQPIYVPVGNFVDTHHSLCYRAYLMDWEIRAHGYECLGGIDDKGPDAAWASQMGGPAQ